MDKKIISQNILRLREREGWTQAELGEKLYVSDKLVSKWERGESLPDADNIVKLAEMSKMSERSTRRSPSACRRKEGV